MSWSSWPPTSVRAPAREKFEIEAVVAAAARAGDALKLPLITGPGLVA